MNIKINNYIEQNAVFELFPDVKLTVSDRFTKIFEESLDPVSKKFPYVIYINRLIWSAPGQDNKVLSLDEAKLLVNLGLDY